MLRRRGVIVRNREVEVRADLILANRAYLDHEAPPGGTTSPEPVTGGLLAALRPAIAPWDGRSGTTWIGAGRGSHDGAWVDERGYEFILTPRGPLRHRRLLFDEAMWRGHYGRVANGLLWPLLHIVREPLPDRAAYYPAPASPSQADWAHYVAANRHFAMAALDERIRSGTCWIHDYQLALVPGMLRAAGFSGRIGFFLHTPFPDLRVAGRYVGTQSRACLREMISGMLGADLVGFQTHSDASRFEKGAMELVGANETAGGLLFEGRKVRVNSYPVGIDIDELIGEARRARAGERFHAAKATGLPVVIGLERADYTKGIPERLLAIARAYREGVRFAYIGVAAPTREGVDSYVALQPAIEEAANEARAAAEATGCWLRQTRELIPWEEVVALQRDADVVFTSSLADGMNLIPMQTAAVQSTRAEAERGVIIAGKDAGVSEVYGGYERDGLVPVDPFDQGAMVATLREAIAGRPGRINGRLVAAIREHDARTWATRFLGDLEGSMC